MIVELLIALWQKTSTKISQEHSMAKTKLELTQAELILMAHVVECAYNEFSNHGCNDLDVTKLGLPVSTAAEIGREMVREGIINEESVSSEDRPYLQDDLVLKLLHKKLKSMIATSPADLEKRILDPLFKAGLVAKVSNKYPLEIVGGRTVESSGGLTVYADGFKIWEGWSDDKVGSSGTYFARKRSQSIRDNPNAYHRIEDAVAYIVGIYTRTSSDDSYRTRRCPW